MEQQPKKSTQVIADFVRQYDLFHSFYRKPFWLIGLPLLIALFILSRMHTFFGMPISWAWRVPLLLVVIILFGVLHTIIRAGQYKALLNFYDFGYMQSVLLKDYFHCFMSLFIAYFFNSIAFCLLGCALFLTPYLYFLLFYKGILENGLTSSALLFGVTFVPLALIAGLPFIYLQSRVRFAMPIIIDKGWGLVRSLRYSMLLTRDGFMPLLRMRWRMMHDEFGSTAINKATKRDLIRILMYRALEERKNDLLHNNMGDV